MIEQAKEVAQRLRYVCLKEYDDAADTIDALRAEVERLTKAQADTKVDAERERFATVMQATVDAKEAADRFIKSKVEPNYDHVICPGCCHQFRAIPVNVQEELARMREALQTLKVALRVGMPEYSYADWLDIVDTALETKT